MSKRVNDDCPLLPVRLDPVSNGEVLPPPSPRLRVAQAIARADAERNARRLGLSRRVFLQSAAGAATTLLAVNRVWAASRPGGFFDLSPGAAADPELAALALSGDEFIFEVQTHHVSPDRSWLAENPHFEFLAKPPRAPAAPAIRCAAIRDTTSRRRPSWTATPPSRCSRGCRPRRRARPSPRPRWTRRGG
jgi:hypothetical protein